MDNFVIVKIMLMIMILDLNYDFYFLVIDDFVLWLILFVVGFILVIVIIVGNLFLFFMIYKNF